MEADLDTLERSAKDASTEMNGVTVATMKAEIKRARIALKEEIPRLEKFSVKRSRHTASRARNLTLEELSQYFHLPINEVSRKLGLCVTVLKQRCREHGILRWPYRKVRKLDNIITALETTFSEPVAASHVSETEEEAKRRLQSVKETRNYLLCNPNSSAHLRLGKLKLGKLNQANSDGTDGPSPRGYGPNSSCTDAASMEDGKEGDSLVLFGARIADRALLGLASNPEHVAEAQDLLSSMENRDSRSSTCSSEGTQSSQQPSSSPGWNGGGLDPQGGGVLGRCSSLFGNHISAFRPIAPINKQVTPISSIRPTLAHLPTVLRVGAFDRVQLPFSGSVHVSPVVKCERPDNVRPTGRYPEVPRLQPAISIAPSPVHLSSSSTNLASGLTSWIAYPVPSTPGSTLASPFGLGTPSPAISPAGIIQWGDLARPSPWKALPGNPSDRRSEATAFLATSKCEQGALLAS